MVSPLPRTTSSEVFVRQTGAPSAAAEINPGAYAGLGNLGRSLRELPGIAKALGSDEEGAAEVTRDPETGELRTPEMRIPWNFWNEEVNRAILTKYGTESEADYQVNIRRLSLENQDDPDKFAKLARAYVDGTVQKAPSALRNDLRSLGTRLAAQYQGRIAEAKMQREIESGKESLYAQIYQRRNDVVVLAGNAGGLETQEGRQALAELRSYYEELVNNPLYGVGRAQADNELSRIQSEARVEALVVPFERKGIGSLASIQAAITDPSLNLSPPEIRAAQNRVEQALDRRRVLADRARALSREARGEAADAITKNLIDLSVSGRLKPEHVQAARNVLSPGAYQAFLSAAVSPAVRDDMNTVYDLMPRVYSGTANQNEITQALRAGRITPDTAQSWYGRMNQTVPSEVSRAYKDIFSTLDRQDGMFGKSEQAATIATRQREATREFDDWMKRNPRATEQQIRAKADDIIAYHGSKLPMAPTPSLLKPSLGPVVDRRLLPKVDFESIRTDLKRRMKARHNGDWLKASRDPDFRRAMDYLKSLEDQARRMPQAAPNAR